MSSSLTEDKKPDRFPTATLSATSFHEMISTFLQRVILNDSDTVEGNIFRIYGNFGPVGQPNEENVIFSGENLDNGFVVPKKRLIPFLDSAISTAVHGTKDTVKPPPITYVDEVGQDTRGEVCDSLLRFGARPLHVIFFSPETPQEMDRETRSNLESTTKDSPTDFMFYRLPLDESGCDLLSEILTRPLDITDQTTLDNTGFWSVSSDGVFQRTEQIPDSPTVGILSILPNPSSWQKK